MMEKEKDVQIRVRIPKSLKDFLEDRAKLHNTSFNKEILARLVQSKYSLEDFHKHVITEYLQEEINQTSDSPYKIKINILIFINRILLEIKLNYEAIQQLQTQTIVDKDMIYQAAIYDVILVKKEYLSFLTHCLFTSLYVYKQISSFKELSKNEVDKILSTINIIKELNLKDIAENKIIEQIITFLNS